MILVDFHEILEEKYKRQEQISELKTSLYGYGIYVGEISPGCRTCFTNEGCDTSVFVGNHCPFNCPMCFYDENNRNMNSKDFNKEDVFQLKNIYTKKFNDINYKPSNITYNSHGEPFLYLEEYKEIYPIIKKIEDIKNINIHKRIYTTGIFINKDSLLKLKDLDVDEIRFHISASNFDSKIFKKIEESKKMGFRITIEEPSWPLNKAKLIESLPIMNDLGVQHLNINEVDITPHNIRKINDIYPKGRMYKNLNYHLYDEGLVYDIIEEKIKNNYNFSVLDCNSDLTKRRFFASKDFLTYDESVAFSDRREK